ncbi:MAG: hypothetical protein JNJ49_05475 [Bdellovibrionaceae bacterium]|nr:hypothetical protein [Pseudobdellovibrionaceae bacterium]
MGTQLLKIRTPQSFETEFKVLSNDIVRLFASSGLKVQSYHDPALVHYSALSDERKAAALERLRIYHQSLVSMENAGHAIDNSSKSLWHALKTLGFMPDSEVFAKFENDDVIEVYDSRGTQMWRNFNYMKICSYTLEELLCHDWPTLYIRDEKLTDQLVKLMVDTVTSGLRGANFIDVDYHLVEERFSTDRFRLNVRHDYICALLRKGGQCDGFLITSKVDVIGQSAISTNWPSLQLAEFRPLEMSVSSSQL